MCNSERDGRIGYFDMLICGEEESDPLILSNTTRSSISSRGLMAGGGVVNFQYLNPGESHEESNLFQKSASYPIHRGVFGVHTSMFPEAILMAILLSSPMLLGSHLGRFFCAEEIF